MPREEEIGDVHGTGVRSTRGEAQHEEGEG